MNLQTQMKLFNAYITDSKTKGFYKDMFERYCIIIPASIRESDAQLIAEIYGTSLNALTATFYSSKEFVESCDEIKLQLMQSLHYLSTYGELVELRNDGQVFSMNSFSDGPIDFIKANVKYINTITTKEAIEKVKTLVQSNIALNSSDVRELFEFIKQHEIKIENIKNRELNLIYLAHYPEDKMGLDLLVRVCNYLISDTTLYVKSTFIEDLSRYSARHHIRKTNRINSLVKRELTANFENAAKDANRHRDVLMLLKKFCDKETKTLINRVLRQSKTKAVPKKFTRVERFFTLSENEQLSLVDNLEIAKAVQILNADKARKNDLFSVYVIRNGARFVKENISSKTLSDKVVNKLTERVKEFVQSLEISLAENVDLAMPTSLKRMIGHLPNCTKITLPKDDYSVGVYWSDPADIDIHAMTKTSHIGWNTTCRDRGIIYSGDMTHLNRNGYAAEYISFNKDVEEDILFEVRLFSGKVKNMKLMISSLSEDVDYFANNVLYDLLVDVESKEICSVFVDTTSSDKEMYVYLLPFTESDSVVPLADTNIHQVDITKSIVTNQTYIQQFLDDEHEVIDIDTFDCSCLLKKYN